MGRQSLISIGIKGFQVMELYGQGKSTSEIQTILKEKLPQNIQGFRKELINAGWIIPAEKGKCKLTESGKFFKQLIYMNEKIKGKLK